jgi:hypothetical protein
MIRSQRGLSFFGALILFAIIAGGGYFGYQWYVARDDAPTCKNDFTACMRMCRRLSSESAEAETCQAGCERDVAACERKLNER